MLNPLWLGNFGGKGMIEMPSELTLAFIMGLLAIPSIILAAKIGVFIGDFLYSLRKRNEHLH